MKLHRLTLLASLFLTIAMSVVALVFDFSNESYSKDKELFYLTLAFCILLIFGLNYGIISVLFNFYGKRQIQRISESLPQEIISPNEQLGFHNLGERVSELNLKNTSEIDTMKEMEDYRKEYIGNVSHELKTPLFSIQGYVETLRDGGVENLSIRDKYLERIGISVERLIHIVNDLDMINRFEAGEIKLNITTFDINSLIKEVFDLLDLEAGKRRAELIFQTAQNQILVDADKQKISQVLINLISNAIHYANRDQAKIIAKTTVLKNKIFIEISDNGMGIKPEVLPRIFERFYRAETSRNRKDGGSGLGLAIVKHILEAHNETIAVESEYLAGTKFSFMLEKHKI